jgi:hypothetical protein
MNEAHESAGLPASDWLARCVQQIRRVETELSDEEATEIAQHLLSFERTGSMPPEAAVEFVVSEFAKTKPRFERRAQARPAKGS